jgi:branched-subunit amino acid ABC-type transport system permease component
VSRSTTALLSGVALTVLAGVLFGIDAASDNDSGGLLSVVGLVVAVPAGMLFFIGGIATAIRWGLADHDEHRLIQTAWDGLHDQTMVEE